MSSSSRSRMSSRISGRMSGLGVSILILLVGFLPMAPLSQLADAAVLPTISVDDVTVTEGTGGTVSAVFHLSQDKRGKTTVRFATSEGTAKAPGDFITKTGRIRFAGNKLTKTVAITVVGDTIDEANENFFLDLRRRWVPRSRTTAARQRSRTTTRHPPSPSCRTSPCRRATPVTTRPHPSTSHCPRRAGGRSRLTSTRSTSRRRPRTPTTWRSPERSTSPPGRRPHRGGLGDR